MEKCCEENIQCSEGETGEIYCQECLTYQCSACERFLHATKEFRVHTRQNIILLMAEPDKLPQETRKLCKHWCSSKNPVSVSCQDCEMDFCEECDSSMHQGRRKSHLRSKYTEEEVPEGKEKTFSSYLLVDSKEDLLIFDEESFDEILGCHKEDKIKVVSIYGNTGDGKSHTLNHTFFSGKEVFKTSSNQQSCTVGIWAAYSSDHNAIFLDSEGLLGASKDENRRTRLLLKILAISDVVIYRTRAERLHNDLFAFLGDASNAYWKYFTPELKNASERCKLKIPLSTLGPSVVIFHETHHTELLGECAAHFPLQPQNIERSDLVREDDDDGDSTDERTGEGHGGAPGSPPMTAEELLRIRFSEIGHVPKAFCSVEYVGTRTQWPPTDFSGLLKSVTRLLKNNAVRAPRTPAIVFKALQILNVKFNGDIVSQRMSTFPDAYFSCPQTCLACGVRCELSMNHARDGVHHKITSTRCNYSPSHDNRIFLCKTCYNRGIETTVFPKTSSTSNAGWIGLAKYAWTGYVIECKHCGVIYQSRKHWYGNKEPEHQAVRTENKHVWPEDFPGGLTSDVTVRRLLDGVESVAGAVSRVSAGPAQMMAGWMTSRVAPKYWIPDSNIIKCGECQKEFTSSMTKHHCRSCGGGFCDRCSSKSMPVPQRGWGNIPVRVCNACYKQRDSDGLIHKSKQTTSCDGNDGADTNDSDDGVTPRYMGEVIQSAIGLASGVISYPKGVMVESARPTYWIADEKITSCHECKVEFSPRDSKHHCRSCGQGFCSKCSSHKAVVPNRGWDYPVRVCDTCWKRK